MYIYIYIYIYIYMCVYIYSISSVEMACIQLSEIANKQAH